MMPLFKSRLPGALAAIVVLLASCSVTVVAQSTPVDSEWQLLVDREARLSPESANASKTWRPAKVNLSWNAQFADMRDYMGVAWYRNRIDIPASSRGRHYWLKFGAVDYLTELFVNGKSAGRHEGGYTPFEFDITKMVTPGMNDLLVRVYDPPMADASAAGDPEYPYDELPHGKQNWYVQTGGIWQSVTLEARPETFIRRVHISPDLSLSGEFILEAEIAGDLSSPVPISVRVNNSAGGEEFSLSGIGNAGKTFKCQGRVKSPQLWAPDHPTLYTAEVAVDGHNVRERFGFRSFSAKGGKFFLNGKAFYMIAALDQDFYPDTIYSAPPEEFIRNMMREGRRLGLNMLRCHIKVPDPVYLKVADEVGMLVWYEIPSWNDGHHFSTKAAARGERIFREMVARDWNHPSIVIQSIINESWGADLKQADQRAWLQEAYTRAKELTAPLGRLVVDNSACCDNFHVHSDVDDFHQYYSIPDNSAKWDQWTADFASRPSWTFSPYGDAERGREEPLVISEFGNWGLPRIPKTEDLPWWFDRDFGGRAVTRPAGVLSRFQTYGFGRLFSDFNSLAEETQRHQFLSLKHEIEDIRSHSSIQGYVITEFTDINWEVNGLMDMWRNPKVYARELATLQQLDLVMGRIPKHNYSSGERVVVPIDLSHYGEGSLEGAYVRWHTSFEASGHFNIKPIPAAGVSRLQTIVFSLPVLKPSARPRREQLFLEMYDRDHYLVGQNRYDLYVYPTLQKVQRILIYDPKNEAAGLQKIFPRTEAGSIPRVPDQTVIASILDSKVQNYLREGGHVILLADTKDALPPGLPLTIVPREGSDLDGNWVTNFNWIRGNALPFENLFFSTILGWEAAAVVPRFVIQSPANFPDQDVLAGIFYGWLNNNAALALQARYGKGHLFITTFRFDAVASDPYAARLLNSFVSYVNSPALPKTDLAAAAATARSSFPASEYSPPEATIEAAK